MIYTIKLLILLRRYARTRAREDAAPGKGERCRRGSAWGLALGLATR